MKQVYNCEECRVHHTTVTVRVPNPKQKSHSIEKLLAVGCTSSKPLDPERFVSVK